MSELNSTGAPPSFVPSMLRVLNPLKFAWLWLLLFVNSQIIVWSSNNPLGVKGFGEFFYAFLLVYSFIYLMGTLSRKDGAVYKYDFVVFVIISMLMVYSALASHIKYGQPLLSGFIESRRVLALLIYYPVVSGIRRKKFTISDVFFVWIWMSLLAVFLGAGVQLDIIPKINEIDVGGLALRQDRASVGNHTVATAFLLLMSMAAYSKNDRVKLYSIAAVLLVALILVNQTRGVFLAAIISYMFISKNFIGWLKKIFWGSLAGGLVLYASLPFVLQTEQGLVMYGVMLELFEPAYWYESVRAQTIMTIFENLSWYGHGALWSQWQDGFATYYGDLFFLADVGIFGTIFQYGIFAIFYIFFYLLFSLKVFLVKDNNYYTFFMKSLAAYLLIMWPIAGILEYRGYVFFWVLLLYVCTKGKRYA